MNNSHDFLGAPSIKNSGPMEVCVKHSRPHLPFKQRFFSAPKSSTMLLKPIRNISRCFWSLKVVFMFLAIYSDSDPSLGLWWSRRPKWSLSVVCGKSIFLHVECTECHHNIFWVDSWHQEAPTRFLWSELQYLGKNYFVCVGSSDGLSDAHGVTCQKWQIIEKNFLGGVTKILL